MTEQTSRRFTGRQITTMVIALMAAVVLLPTTVWAAVTFTNVAIADPAGHTAMVTPLGELKTDSTPPFAWSEDITAPGGTTFVRTSVVNSTAVGSVTITNPNGVPVTGRLVQVVPACIGPGSVAPLLDFTVQGVSTLPLTFPAPLVIQGNGICPPSTIEVQVNDSRLFPPLKVTVVGYDF